MTRLRVLSDLHIEFGPMDLEPADEDVLVLAGDIGQFTDGAEWAIDYAVSHRVPVVMVAGNHEFYRSRQGHTHTLRSTIAALRRLNAREPLFTFLEDDIATVADVTFVGATLWTDYALYGMPASAMMTCASMMNDHNLIVHDEGLLKPSDALKIHQFSVGVLRERLPRRFDEGRPFVVVTHHLPSARSVDPRYRDDPVSAGYASNLDGLVFDSGAALWVHGHTHTSHDYRIGATRVLCNPRGYAPHDVNPEFNRDLVVEV